MTIGLSVIGMLLLQSSQADLTAQNCEDANNSFLIACLAFVVIAVIVAVLLKRFWDKRHQWNPGIRFGVSLLIATIISTVLVAWNPVRNEVLEDCLESEEFSRYITMSHMAAIPRGLILGGAVSAILFIIILLVLRIIAGRGK